MTMPTWADLDCDSELTAAKKVGPDAVKKLIHARVLVAIEQAAHQICLANELVKEYCSCTQTSPTAFVNFRIFR